MRKLMNAEDGPFFVHSTDGERLGCTRWADGRFHVFERGRFTDLLWADYILAVPRLAAVLKQSCGTTLEIKPTQLVNVVTGHVWGEYCEVQPAEELDLQNFRDVERSGRRAWHVRENYLFVTSRVADDLIAAGFDSLTFMPRERAARLTLVKFG